MWSKRRDNKNRVLRSGESQRKDGRYAYKYTDTHNMPDWEPAYLDTSDDRRVGGVILIAMVFTPQHIAVLKNRMPE